MNKFFEIAEKYLNRRIHPVSLGIARIIFFTMFLIHFKNNYEDTNWFNLNWQLNWVPVSFFKLIPIYLHSKLKYSILFYLMYIGGLFALLGLFTRISIIVCFLSGVLFLGLPLNFGKLHHSNHMIVMTLFFLCWVENHYLTLDDYLKKLIFKKQPKLVLAQTHNWAINSLILYMCVAYFESGFQKLLHCGLNWFHPDNLSLILLTRQTVTEFGVWAAHQSWLMSILAFMTIVVEFGAPMALFHKRLFYFIGFSLFCFHFGTWMTMGAHGDFRKYSTCFVFWIPWAECYFFLKRKLDLKIK